MAPFADIFCAIGIDLCIAAKISAVAPYGAIDARGFVIDTRFIDVANCDAFQKVHPFFAINAVN